LSKLSGNAQHLARAQDKRLQNMTQQLDFLQRRLTHPAQQHLRQTEQLTQLQYRLQRAAIQHNQSQHWRWKSVLQRFRGTSQDLVSQRDKQINLAVRLFRSMQSEQVKRLTRVENIEQQLAILNPQKVLERGYSLVKDESGELVRDVSQLSLGADLNITFAKGQGRVELKGKG
jgi:exodeoxyribonuclease VII large subunit